MTTEINKGKTLQSVCDYNDSTLETFVSEFPEVSKLWQRSNEQLEAKQRNAFGRLVLPSFELPGKDEVLLLAARQLCNIAVKEYETLGLPLEIFLSAELREIGVLSLSETTIKDLSTHLDTKYRNEAYTIAHRDNAQLLGEFLRAGEQKPMQSFKCVALHVQPRCVNRLVETLGTDFASFEFAIETREYIRNVLRSLSAFAHWTQSPSLAQFVEDLRLTMTSAEFRWDGRHPFCESVEDLEVELYDNQLSLLFRFALWDRIDLYLKEYGGYLHC